MKVNRSTISRCFKRYREEGFLKDGIYQVAFSIYRQGKDWRSLSMADQGFEKPAYLYLQENQKYLELSVKEMKAMTKGGAMLSGHIQTVKCRSSRDVLMNLPIKNKKIQIPFEDFQTGDPLQVSTIVLNQVLVVYGNAPVAAIAGLNVVIYGQALTDIISILLSIVLWIKCRKRI